MTTIGAYEAKTHLPRLLKQVEGGETVTITKHGREIARLVPVHATDGAVDDVVRALLEARRGVTRGATTVREMLEEGRR